jgi:hypothetical protein
VISESLDECSTNSWVFSKGLTDVRPSLTLIDTCSESYNCQDAPKIIGRVSDILIDPTGVVLVVLERFQVLRERDDVYGMPVLVRRDGEVTFSIVPAKVPWISRCSWDTD